MTFAWPWALLSVLMVPLLLAAYIWQIRRKRKVAVRFSNVALVRAAVPRRSAWKRHVPAGLLLAGLGGLGVASARPQASVLVPLGKTSIILALDVSRSMCATDIAPNRLTVAKEAAVAFVRDQPSGTRIGIVAFAGFAELVVTPTTDKDELIQAIEGLTTSRGTVIGAATLKAIDAIAAVNPDVRPVGVGDEAFAEDPDFGSDPAFGSDGGSTAETSPATPAAPPSGDYVPDIVVLLTDGANTRGIDPLEAAKVAADRRVRVYTIGFGTENPTELSCTVEQLGGDSFADGGFGGGRFGGPSNDPANPGGDPGAFRPEGRLRQFLVMDEPTLRAVAETTGGAFYAAADAEQLRGVFTDLPKTLELQRRDEEISVGFAAFGALFAAAAMALSLLWNRSP